MTVFWIAAAVMVIATVVTLVVTIERNEAQAPNDHDQAVYRAQIKDVEDELGRGVIAESEAEAARAEVRRRLLAAVDRAAIDRAADSLPLPQWLWRLAIGLGIFGLVSLVIPNYPRWMEHLVFGLGLSFAIIAISIVISYPRWAGRLIAALGVPVSALALYLVVGAPGLPDQPLATRGEDLANVREMEDLLRQLGERMAKTPDDVQGWILLGRSYQTLGHLQDSTKAFGRAVEVSGRSADALAEYGEALMAAEDGQVTAEATAAFEEAVGKDPANARARYYLGLAKAQTGDAAGAIAAWVEVVRVSPDNALCLPMVRDVATTAGLAPPHEATAAPGPSQADVENAARMNPEDRTRMILGMVERLAERLEDDPDDLNGCLRLARAYEVLGETDKAKAALARADALRPRNQGPTR